MAEKLTPQQQTVITNRGGPLLVSASAGSGKTKVLIDRLMGYLTDPVQPANLDDFLIITFTKAAAAELQGKIAAKLSQRIAEAPGNRHLQRQMQRLYLAKISTVHSYCTDLLREYAYNLDLPADFRVAEELECRQLQVQVMDALLENAYEIAAEDPDIRSFLDTQGMGRDDRMVPEILIKVYQNSRCHLDPEGWLTRCVEETQRAGRKDAAETIWGEYLIKDLHSYLDLQIPTLMRCAQEAEAANRMAKPAQVLRDTIAYLENLRACTTWDAIADNRVTQFRMPSFPQKDVDKALCERIKAVYKVFREGVLDRLRYFSNHSEQVLQDLAVTGAAARGLVALVRAFGAGYEQLKRRRRVMDFNDLEQKTLELLWGKKRCGKPMKIALEIGQRYREVMVDEYQDSNGVQDAIYAALTWGRGNCFMVGDVKQAIYQFRLADPGIFLEKYNTYAPAEQASDGQGRKVLLSSNFRSSGGIIDAVNQVFSTNMSPAVGGIAYAGQELMREGIPHIPLNTPEVEFYMVHCTDDAYGQEAGFVAERICQLLDGKHFVRQEDTLRPITPGDIVILLRSPSSTEADFQYALEKRGLPCASGDETDLLKTQEVSVLRALLQVISNPLQDIPLAAVLTSPVFGFTADDLAALRAGRRDVTLFAALQTYSAEKTGRFLQMLSLLRKQSRRGTLAQLLERIFAVTRMDSLYASMPDGQKCTANLQAFYQAAADYEGAELRDLDQFLEHLEAQEEKGMAGPQKAGADAIRIMSIHKSKGLEFPVVFLCGLSKRFNKRAAQEQVLCDRELGLGLSCVDVKKRIRYPSIAKRAIAVKLCADGLSEEMRVLYVAMTRARDRLIMTYAEDKPEEVVADFTRRMDMCQRELMTKEVSGAGDWVLLTALQRTDAGALFAMGGRPRQTHFTEPAWTIRVVEPVAPETAAKAEAEQPDALDAQTLERLAQSLAFTYAYLQAVQTPSKMTATQLKGRFKDQESAEYAQEQKPAARTWRAPSFADQPIQGKAYGNVLHAVMQYIRFEACGSEDGVRQEVKRLESEGFISPEQAEAVDCGQIAAFFATPMGQKLRGGAHVLREFKFSILDDGARYAPGMQGEKVLLQGVVDCALLEEDGITVIDFKTDNVTDQTVQAAAERYQNQVRIYADALAKIHRKNVKDKLLYFFRLGQFISVK